MKRFAALVLLVLLASGAYAQGWSNFFHPRPPIVKSDIFGVTETASAAVWQFKPTLSLIAASFTPGVNGGPWVNGIFNGAGPALTYEYSTQDVNGVNYAEYSVSLGVYFAGATNTDPNFQPAVALMVGALNNIANVGVGAKISSPADGSSRFFLLASFNINLTEN